MADDTSERVTYVAGLSLGQANQAAGFAVLAFDYRRLGESGGHPRQVVRIGEQLADLEAALGDNVWLDGNEFTVGDLMMISVLGGLRNTTELADFPRLAGYIARGESRPAHRKAMADHMATFDAPALA